MEHALKRGGGWTLSRGGEGAEHRQQYCFQPPGGALGSLLKDQGLHHILASSLQTLSSEFGARSDLSAKVSTTVSWLPLDSATGYFPNLVQNADLTL